MGQFIRKGLRLFPHLTIAAMLLLTATMQFFNNSSIPIAFAANTVTSASYLDNNNDGSIDTIRWVLDENVTACNFESGDWTIDTAGTINVVAITGTSCTGSDPNLDILVSTTSNITGGPINPTISYADTASPTTGSITLTSGAMTGKAAISAIDGAAPVPLSASYRDTDANGTVDQIDIIMTAENSISCTFESTDWTFGAAGDINVNTPSACATTGDTLELTIAADANETGGGINPDVSYTNGNTLDQFTDSAGNAVATFASSQTVTDAASPIPLSALYKDIDNNGSVDRIDITMTAEASLTCAFELADWNIGTAGDITASAPSACATSGNDVQVSITADAGETSATTNPTLSYTNGGVSLNEFADGSGNAVATFAAQTATDGAAPVILSFSYQDNNSDGQVDQFLASFSETVDAASVLASNDLNLTSVGDFTSAAFGADNNDQIIGNVSSVAITLGTASSVKDTLDDSNSIAINSQNSFSLTDGTNTNSTLGTQTQATIIDEAAPTITQFTYQDNDNNGQIDRFTVDFSETLDTASVLAANDLTISNAGDFVGADFVNNASDLINAAVSSIVVVLGTEATAVDTNEGSGNLAISSQNSFSLSDGTNINTTLTSQVQATFVDGAAPFPVSSSVEDVNNDGTLDLITVVWSENLSTVADATADWNLNSAADFAGLTEGAVECNNGGAATNECDYNFTTTTVKTDIGDLSLAYTAGTSVTDGTNTAASATLTSASTPPLTDNAKPVATSATAFDGNSDNRLDLITIVWSENLSTVADGTVDWNISSAADFAGLTEGTVECNNGGAAANECDYNFTTTTAKSDIGDLDLAYTAGTSVTDGTNTANSITFTNASSPAISDAIGPFLNNWSIDMNAGTASLTFSEAVNTATFNATAITIQDAATATTSYTLTTSGTTSPNGTSVVINLSTADLNALKLNTGVGTAQADSFIIMTTGAIDDTSGNDVSAIADGSALQATTHTADTTAPNLTSWTINLNTGQLGLTYDEPVNATSLDVTGITLQNAATATTSYTLTTSSSPSPNGTSLSIALSATDLDNLKLNTGLTTALADSFIIITNTSVDDMNNNDVVAIADGTAQQTVTHTPDTTSPNLASWTIDMNSGQLALTFDEPVNAGTLATTAITLQDAATATSSATLTGGSTASANGRVITVSISTTDLNTLKLNTGLVTAQSNSFITLTTSLIDDMNSNDNTAIADGAGLQTTTHTPDSTNPNLTTWDLDMNALTLSMNFDEPVLASSLSAAGITIQDAATATTSYTLTTSNTASVNGLNIVVNLSTIDANAIKVDTGLGTAQANSFLAIAASTIDDMNNNDITAIANGAGVQANSHTPDTTSPNLSTWDLDMNDGTVTLNFDEAVNSATFIPSTVVLQNAATSTSNYTLTTSTTASANGAQIVITLTTVDLNALKLNTGLVTSNANSFIRITNTTVDDMNGNDAVAIPDGAGIQVSTYTGDTTAPNLSSWDLNMNTGIISLTFDEPVLASSLNGAGLVIQNAATAATSYTLTGGSTASANGLTVVLNVTSTDLNAIKVNTGIGTIIGTSFIRTLATAVDDMATNDVNVIADGAAIIANSYTPDTTPPSLSTWTIDINAGTAVLNFNEPVDRSTLDVTQITIQDTATATTSVTLTDSSSTSADGTAITINLSTTDLNALKLNTGLATSTANSFIRFTSSTIDDMNGNDVTGKNDGLAAQATTHTPDTTSPSLISWDLNINSGRLSLVFDESVNTATFAAGAITLQDAATATTTYTLTTSATTSGNGATVIVDFTAADLDAIKLNTGLGASQANSFIRITAGLVDDMANNDNTAIANGAAIQVNTFTADTTAPNLTAWTVDINTGTANLTFDEPVNTGSFNAAGFTLQNATTATTSFTLTTSTTASANGRTVIVNISNTDLNAIKFDTNIATSTANSFIRVANTAINDMNNNDISVIADGAGLQAGAHTPDTTAPNLSTWELNMNSGRLALNFDETVNATSLSAGQITLQDAATAITSYTLTTSTTASGNSTTIIIDLSDTDLDAIKLNTGLGISAGTSFIRFTSTTIDDMNSNDVTAIADGAAVAVNTYTADSTAPTLSSWDFNVNTNAIVLTFNEPVNSTTLSTTSLTIQDAATATSSVTLTGGSTASANGRTIVVDAITADMNNIKVNTGLATSAANSFLRFTNTLIDDMANNDVTAIADGAATAVNSHTPDTTAPTLTSWSIDINAATASLVFDEPVNASTLSVTGIVLQDAATATTSFTLTDSTTASVNGTSIVINLSTTDLNSVKLNTGLVTAQADSFITLSNAVIDDMNSNDITAIADGVGVQAATHTADTTAPNITAWNIDFNVPTLTLTFDEPVNASTLSTAAITLQNAATATNPTYTLTAANTTASVNGTAIVISLTQNDLFDIRANTGIVTGTDNAFLISANTLIDDMANNDNTVIADGTALQAVSVDGSPVNPSGGSRRTSKKSAAVTPVILTTSENGTSATFTVVLESSPSGDVTIDITSSNTNEVTVSPSQLVFTPSNATTAQTVTVLGIDDSIADGNTVSIITLAPMISTDAGFNDVDPTDVSVTNTDNEVSSGGGGGGGSSRRSSGGGGGGSSFGGSSSSTGSVLGATTSDSTSSDENITEVSDRTELRALRSTLKELYGEIIATPLPSYTLAAGTYAGNNETTLENKALNLFTTGTQLPEQSVTTVDSEITFTVSEEVSFLRPVFISIPNIGTDDRRTLKVTDANDNTIHAFAVTTDQTLVISTNTLRELTITTGLTMDIEILPDAAENAEKDAILALMEMGIINGHPDGTFKPNDPLKRAHTAKIIGLRLGLTAADAQEGDQWYSAILRALTNAGIIKGNISPEAFELRANFLALIAKAQGININSLEACTDKPFDDVEIDTWYCPLVQHAKNNGWILETEGNFNPSDVVTRGAAAGWVNRGF